MPYILTLHCPKLIIRWSQSQWGRDVKSNYSSGRHYKAAQQRECTQNSVRESEKLGIVIKSTSFLFNDWICSCALLHETVPANFILRVVLEMMEKSGMLFIG